jgi:CubicO group peptidase (beta-lactamase class C family)
MSQQADSGAAAFAGLESIWRVPDGQVASGRIPGYAGAVRVGGQTATRVGGRMAIEPESRPMSEQTLFRIASLTKPVGGALALSMLQDGLLALDDPISRWLPEAASPRVLTDPAGPLDQTRPASTPITVRHLLTLTAGWGAVLDPSPLQAAMLERGVSPGPLCPPMPADEYVARVTSLPLAFEPGQGWLYDTGMDLTGVLLARLAGRPLSDLLAERITEPLGMTSTAFWTPEPGRLATAYRPAADGLELLDPPDGEFSRPPHFEELSSGLVSTAGDMLRFFCALADGGAPVLSAESVALMTADALSPSQRQQALPIAGPGVSWGLGTGVASAGGACGWNGGTGTTGGAYANGTAAVLLTQRGMSGPQDGFGDFWAAVRAAA